MAFKAVFSAGQPTPPDNDGDGVADTEDNCPSLANADQADLDNDGQGNVCDGDRDGDGVANDSDYAPDDPNVQTPPPPSGPTDKADCRQGGYKDFGFKNQGQCIKAVNHATPADTTPPEITVTGPEGQWSELYPVYTLATNEPVSWQCTFTFTPFGGTTPTQTGSDPCSTGTKLWGANQDGIWVFTFKATDVAGNTSTVTKTLLLDTTP